MASPLPRKPPTSVEELTEYVEHPITDYLELIREVGEQKANEILNRWRITKGLIMCSETYNKGAFRHLRTEAMTILGISEQHLRRCVLQDKGLLELVHGNASNQNRKKVDEEEHLQAVRAMLKRHATQKQIAEKLSLSIGTVNRLINDPKYLQGNTIAKWGWKEYKSRFDIIIKRTPPTKRNLLWVADGTTLELLANIGNNKAGRFYWVYVVDAATWDLIGYAIGKTESFKLVKRAFFNAYKNTGVLPNQIQSDNGSAFKSKEAKAFLLGICQKFTPHGVGNARSKMAESWWNVLNASFLKDEANWTGKNITAKSGPMLQSALSENLKVCIKVGLPDINGIQTQLERCLDNYRNVIVKGKGGNDLECGGRMIGHYDMAVLFWDFLENRQDNENRYIYTNKGIGVTIDGTNYQYLVQSAEGIPDKMFHLTGITKMFRVKIDKDNPQSGIVLYEGDKPVTMANLVDAMPMAIADHTPETRARLAAMLAQKKENRRQFEEIAATSLDTEFIEMQMTNYKLALGNLGKDGLNSGEEAVKFADFEVLEDADIEKPKPKKQATRQKRLNNNFGDYKKIEIVQDKEDDFDINFEEYEVIED